MVDGGVADVLVSNEIVGARKLERLAALARARSRRCASTMRGTSTTSRRRRARAGVRLESTSRSKSAKRRCGVAPGEPAVALARARSRQRPSLRFAGLQAYHGRAQHITSVGRSAARAIETGIADVRNTIDLLKRQRARLPDRHGRGHAAASSWRRRAASATRSSPAPTASWTSEYARNEGFPRAFRQSLFVLATVMSRPDPERAVVDAGLKALSVDKGMPRRPRPRRRRVPARVGRARRDATSRPGGQRPPRSATAVARARPLRSHHQPLRLVRRACAAAGSRRSGRSPRAARSCDRAAPAPAVRRRAAGGVARGGVGPPLVLVHGAGGSAGLWPRQLDGLADVAQRSRAGPPGSWAARRPGTPEHRRVRGVARHLPRDAVAGRAGVVVGHSMGGAVAQALALLRARAAWPGWC